MTISTSCKRFMENECSIYLSLYLLSICCEYYRRGVMTFLTMTYFCKVCACLLHQIRAWKLHQVCIYFVI